MKFWHYSFRWSKLHALGESRLLKISYVIMIGVPFATLASNWWNTRAELYWDQQSEKREEPLNNIEEIYNTQTPRCKLHSELNPKLDNWLLDASVIVDKDSLAEAIKQAKLFHDSTESECRHAFQQWISIAKRQMQFPAWQHFEFPPRLRWLYFGMLLVAFGNLIYVGYCPAILRQLHKAEWRGTQTQHGDFIDWALALYDQIKGDDDPKERRGLIADLLKMPWDKELLSVESGLNNRKWIIAKWNNYQTSFSLMRFICTICYSLGLSIIVYTIVVQVRVIWSA